MRSGYWKRLLYALLGKDDTPIRDAQLYEAIDLLAQIPSHIEGSTERTSADNLRWLLQRTLVERSSFPVDKTGRWIGFVHGVLALSGHLDVDFTRNRSRERYHQAYRKTWQAIPKTKNLGDK